MKNPLKRNQVEYHDFGILTNAEQDRFRNYHLPLFTCPSCGSIKNGEQINTMGSPCLKCGDTESLEEFETSSYKQFKKGKSAFHLEMSIKEHQELIAHFRQNILWQCDQCERQNFNLPKNSKGEPDITKNTSCDGCSHPYETGRDFLSFWALKDYGFDDGDDDSNVYELKKLGEQHFLWLKAIRKARKIDAENGNNNHNELHQLQEGLQRLKKRTRSISGGKWKDGNKASQYLETYLLGQGQAKANRVFREVKDYTKGVLMTNDSYAKTPHGNDSTLLQKYLYNLSHLDASTVGWTLSPVLVSLALSAIIEGTWQKEIGEPSHQAHLEREDKGVLDLHYNISRREPYYSGEVKYRTIHDTTGQARYIRYTQQADFYQLQTVGTNERVSNGYTSLDTGKNRWVEISCPEVDSGGSSGGGFSPSGGSSGMGNDGSGGVFHRPELEEFLPDGYQDITSLSPGIGDTILSTSGEILLAIIGVSPAHAASCGGYSEDITVRAERFVTIQSYSVWDWKEKNWFTSEIENGMDYSNTFTELESSIITDTDNQRNSGEKLTMMINIIDENNDVQSIPVQSEQQWRELNRNIGAQCEISKPYLFKWWNGITADDLSEQCI